MKRPVAWGAVLLSYAGIIGVVAYAAATGAASQGAVRAEQKRADIAIVQTGRKAIVSGCHYDNQRTKELRGILKRSLANQRSLMRKNAIDPGIARHNIRITLQDLADISRRDCAAEASILTLNPPGNLPKVGK